MSNLSNNLGIAVGIIPGIVVMTMIKSNAGKPWCLSNLLASLALIGIAVFLFHILVNSGVIFELLKAKGEISAGEHEQLKSSTAIWLALAPAILGGIGVNVLSEWLLSKRPD